MDHENPATERLTRRLRKGEEDAYREFYDTYGVKLLRYLAALHQGDIDSAKDTLQATILKAAKHMKVFHEEEVFWGWIRRIGRTTFIDSQRKASRYRKLMERFTQHALAEQVGQDRDGSEERLSAAIKRAVEALAPDSRKLIEARYFEQLSHAQIAKLYDVTPRAVEGRLARIRGQLRSTMAHSCKDA